MGMIVVTGSTPFAMLVFGLVAWRPGNARGLDTAALLLLAPLVALMLLGIAESGVSHTWSRDLPDVLRVCVAPMLIVAVQWVCLRLLMRRPVSA